MKPDLNRLLFKPDISINGLIEQQTLTFVLDQLQAVRDGSDDLVVELNTQGGDADVARRIAHEVAFFCHSGRQGCCVGRSNVFSAGITILAAFPKTCRFVTDDTVLLIHERRLEKTLQLQGLGYSVGY